MNIETASIHFEATWFSGHSYGLSLSIWKTFDKPTFRSLTSSFIRVTELIKQLKYINITVRNVNDGY